MQGEVQWFPTECPLYFRSSLFHFMAGPACVLMGSKGWSLISSECSVNKNWTLEQRDKEEWESKNPHPILFLPSSKMKEGTECVSNPHGLHSPQHSHLAQRRPEHNNNSLLTFRGHGIKPIKSGLYFSIWLPPRKSRALINVTAVLMWL